MKRTDWSSWVSLVAIASVCIAVAAPLLTRRSEVAAQEPTTPKAERSGRTERSSPRRPDVVPERKPSMVPEQQKELVPDEKPNVVPDTQPDVVPERKAGTRTGAGRYKINDPSRTLELGKALAEISGLSMAKGGDSLWAVHDERGTLYRLSTLDGSVQQEVDLGKRGDYEGVEEVGGRVWVVRSDGVVLVVDPSGKSEPEKLTFTRDVGLACDVEGVAHDARNERLLFACKNEGWKSSRKDGKAWELFAMDLETRKIGDDPAILIRAKDLDAHGVKGKNFAPSGLAVHPKTGELYVLSARGNMLVVLSPSGEVVRVDTIDPEVHRQPEGIAFGDDGTMYLSDEAKGHEARLYVIKQ